MPRSASKRDLITTASNWQVFSLEPNRDLQICLTACSLPSDNLAIGPIEAKKATVDLVRQNGQRPGRLSGCAHISLHFCIQLGFARTTLVPPIERLMEEGQLDPELARG